jgi:hypothetical protein
VPTALKVGGYRFFFFSNERKEPRHVHVESAERYAKFWLSPAGLAVNHGFRSSELSEIRRLIDQHEAELIDKWNEDLGG